MPDDSSLADQGILLTRAPGVVLVADTPKGRAVFASQPIASGTLIDVSPVLIFTEDEVTLHTSRTCLDHYTYYWPSHPSNSTQLTPRDPPSSQPSLSSYTTTNSPSRPTQALALGLGSLFNHSTLRQNVGWKRDLVNTCIVYTALRDIQPGEELCISYGSLWFEDADAAAEEEKKKETADGHGDLALRELGGIDVEL